MNLRRKGHLLMVDDDPEDILLVRLAAQRAALPLIVNGLTDGSNLISHLESLLPLPGADDIHPNLLIFLDLNMPHRDGHSCLLDIKRDKRFINIPVIVFSTSESPDDIQDSYRLHANSYICKPGDIVTLEQLLTTVYEYWFTN